jgi:NADH-quinone oxidoreductase subunit E
MACSPVTLSPEFIAQADTIIARYPASRRSASLPLLHHWQETFGYITPQGIEWIAQKLDLQPINILELVTFYPMFRQHPAGKIQIKVCRTLSCALAGSHELYHHLCKRLQTAPPDSHGLAVTPDHRYSVEFIECLAACGTAPVIMIGNDHHEAVTPQKADELLKQYSTP